MIVLPISNRDLLRSVMARVPAAGVRYADPRLQEAVEDSELGMCSFEIVRCAEIKETVMVYDLEGVGRPHTTTRQQYQVQIQYQNPELQFLKTLEWGMI